MQAARAIAALLVVLFHVNHSIFSLPKYWSDKPFGDLFEFGHAGVQFFFVLSGFIIFTAHRADIGMRHRVANFAWKRARRIYPVYWVTLCLVVPAYFLFPTLGTGIERQTGVIIDSLSLVHLFGNGGTILTVAWTLFHEALFYAVFAVLILDRRVGFAVLAAWLAGSVLAMTMVLPPLLAFYLSPMHLLFGMGMGAAALVSDRQIPHAAAVLGAGVAVFGAAAAWEIARIGSPDDVLTLLYGAGSTLVVLGAVELERGERIRVGRWLVFLGNASYSVYLVHFVALSLLAKVAVMVTARVPVPHALIFVALVATSAGLGLLYHVFVEVPVLAALPHRWPSLPSLRSTKETAQ